MENINRRTAIHRTSALLCGTLSSSLLFGVLSGCSAEIELNWIPKVLTPEEALITADLTEQILPATDTPGAKEAGVEKFVDQMIAGYLTDKERTVFKTGLAWLKERKFHKKTPEGQHNLVAELAEEARKQGQQSEPKPFYLLAKEMTLLGFFTSEIGATQVLNYDPVPGGYLGCKPLQEVGGKTWAS
jgi:hypothetical protein